MLPSDMRFKVLAFVGDIKVETAAARIRQLSEQLEAPESFLQRFGHGDSSAVFDVICVSSSSKEDVDWTGKHRTAATSCRSSH